MCKVSQIEEISRYLKELFWFWKKWNYKKTWHVYVLLENSNKHIDFGQFLVSYTFRILLQNTHPFLCNVWHSSLKPTSAFCSNDSKCNITIIQECRTLNGCNSNYSCTKWYHIMSYGNNSTPTLLMLQLIIFWMPRPGRIVGHPITFGWRKERQQTQELWVAPII